MSAVDLPDNVVMLRGRVSAAASERTLPSGDRVVSLRLIVNRAPQRKPETVRVDTFDCVAWGKRIGDALLKLRPADEVEIEGMLRRRFWRGQHGAAVSRIDVEVSKVHRLRRHPPDRAQDRSGR